jgi:hypothetical protein
VHQTEILVADYSHDIGDTYSQDMGNTFSRQEVRSMPWKGVTVTEQRQRFLEDYSAQLVFHQ